MAVMAERTTAAEDEVATSRVAADEFAGFDRLLGRRLDRRGDLIKRRSGLLQRRGLLLCAARQFIG
jgi:hypothetical protein